ncbi:hypothetical protein BDY21DRAFT_333026 [Lineolata rhizophorae]|uniref:Uncharacterized protein n=1 Tax=Lineolata rhizophorae TaxID=578093 RepID=A0A6A6PE86_9PEZI|nr:hypothetical protein BDY21DRAFT_333026 [Lineolata rhizophorae]
MRALPPEPSPLDLAATRCPALAAIACHQVRAVGANNPYEHRMVSRSTLDDDTPQVRGVYRDLRPGQGFAPDIRITTLAWSHSSRNFPSASPPPWTPAPLPASPSAQPRLMTPQPHPRRLSAAASSLSAHRLGTSFRRSHQPTSPPTTTITSIPPNATWMPSTTTPAPAPLYL